METIHPRGYIGDESSEGANLENSNLLKIAFNDRESSSEVIVSVHENTAFDVFSSVIPDGGSEWIL